MPLFDTHVHLTDQSFRVDRDAVLARARQAGVEYLLECGYDLPSSRRGLALARENPLVFCAVGIHPHDARTLAGKEDELEALARAPTTRAIGETGLDFYRRLSPRAAQIAAFEFQLRLAHKLDLPAIIHIRQAQAEAWEVIERVGHFRAVLHCYSGDPALARRAAKEGLFFGLGGALTYDQQRAAALVRALPRDRILLETDSPYLAPVPHRGRRNEPANVVLVNRLVASLLGFAEDAFATLTTQNARRFLGIG